MDYSSYQSPFSYRYGSPEVRRIWSEENKRLLWRNLWVDLADALSQFGLVTPEQVEDLRSHRNDVDMASSLAVEDEIHHDLMAEVKVFAGQCSLGGRIIHLGATSMDIKDNAEVLQIRQSLDFLLTKLRRLLLVVAEKALLTADLPCLAFTHLQPAEPTTYGYRFASMLQDLETDFRQIQSFRSSLKGKGFKGAVGNAATFVELLGGEQPFNRFEGIVSQRLNLPFFSVTTQTYTRKQDLDLFYLLSSLAGTIYKAALDLRLLQSSVFAETAEPFGKKQVGSSAMPFKRNPIQLEKIDSLARMISAYPGVAWGNYAHSLLERTLDDSGNRRTMLPEIFLAADEILLSFTAVISGLEIKEPFIEANLAKFAPFAATERILLQAVKKGADRQQMHEHLRTLSMQAWKQVEDQLPNNLVDLIRSDVEIKKYLNDREVEEAFDISRYLGVAVTRSRELATRIVREYTPA